jgi:hypothetical protein
MSQPLRCDIAVIGASLGGVLAAWRASQAGHQVILVCEEPWIGGQMTAQAVPPDEHAWIEQGGASASYLRFRQDIRAHYQTQAGFRDQARMTEGCNPGDGWVSRLCFEPVLAARWFERLLQSAQVQGRLRLLRLCRPVTVARRGPRIDSVTVQRLSQDLHEVLRAQVFIDATDTGELLALAQLPYRIGKEAQSEFGEPDAPWVADPLDQQPITQVMALRRCSHPGPVGPAPVGYARWCAQGVPGHQHALFSPHLPGRPAGQSHALPFSAEDDSPTLDWWRYRRIISARQWEHGLGPEHDVSLMNWAQNDYTAAPLIDGPCSQEEVQAQAQQLSRCLLHWLQTEAPRPDGGKGYPHWQPAAEVLGTADGMAPRPYVRESRRMRACTTLTQLELMRAAGEAVDGVAIAWYPLDIHPTCRSGHSVNAAVEPFVIPLGSFVSTDVDNLLPGSKNLGVSHLANACTRVHPAEWAIGEVAGTMAGVMAEQRCGAQDLMRAGTPRETLYTRLDQHGVARRWPEDLLRHRASRALPI